MAVGYNTAQTPTVITSSSAIGSPWAAGSYTPESGSDRMAILIIGYGESGGIGLTSAVTLGGQSMTQIGSNVTNSSWVSVTAWRLNEAGIAAMSGSAISVSNSGAGTQQGIVAFTLTGSAGTTSSPQSGSGSSTTAASAAVTSTSDGMVIAGLMSDSTVAGVTLSGSGSDDSGGLRSAQIAGDTLICAQYLAGTGGSITLSWAQSPSDGYAVISFNVNAVAAGGVTTAQEVPAFYQSLSGVIIGRVDA